MSRHAKCYAMYKGDEFIDLGTAEELANRQKISKNTVLWHANSKRLKKSRENLITVIVIEDD